MKSLICGVFSVILAAAILDEAHSVENTFVSIVTTQRGISYADGMLITEIHVLVPTGTFLSDQKFTEPNYFLKHFICRPITQLGMLEPAFDITNQLIIKTGSDSPLAVVTMDGLVQLPIISFTGILVTPGDKVSVLLPKAKIPLLVQQVKEVVIVTPDPPDRNLDDINLNGFLLSCHDGLIGVYDSGYIPYVHPSKALKTVYTFLQPFFEEINAYVRKDGCRLRIA